MLASRQVVALSDEGWARGLGSGRCHVQANKRIPKDQADSTGRRNTLISEVFKIATEDWSRKTGDVPEELRRQWRADRALRPAMRSPGRPDPSRVVQRQFWR
ncbi:hypothetical protein ABK046_05400, partial [Streptomyces caeruleatus]